jgi:YebC/PmpR family DNA-binding regulatory protein
MTDQERNFETLSREITVAVREQGGDPGDNFWLTDALKRAHDINMPDARIERARKLGSGEADGPKWEQTTLEGYGPNGVAVYMKLLTEDPHGSSHEIESVFEQHGGNLGDDGCVSWQFERRGVIEVGAGSVGDADEFMLEVIEMGGQELDEPVGTDDTYRVYTDADEVGDVATALKAAGHSVVSASIDYESTQHVPLDSSSAREFLGFFEKLKMREDVLGAYSNWTMA